MASRFLTTLSALAVGGAAALAASAALAGGCGGGDCAWVSASQGYEFGPRPAYAQQAPAPVQGQGAYGYATGYGYVQGGYPTAPQGYVPAPAPCNSGCYQPPVYQQPVYQQPVYQ